jgi:PAS domain S-box-containing protein
MSETVMEKLELKRSKRLLEQRKDEFELAEDFADIGHWRLDPNSETVHWSDEVYRITGFDPDESPPDLDDALKLYPEEDRRDVRKAIKGAMENGEKFELRTRLRDQSGSIHHVRIQGKPYFDSQDTVSEVFGVIKDVTDEVDYQREVQRREKLAAIGEMAASIMHEINNPNAIIQGNLNHLEDLRENLANSSRSEQTIKSFQDDLPEITGAMKKSSRRIERITDRVEQFAFESEPPELEYCTIHRCVELFDKIATLYQVRDDCTVRIENKPTKSTTESIPIASDDWSTILFQLLENAVDAARKAQEPSVSCRLNCGDNLELTIKNNGNSLSDKLKSRVTDPFFSSKPIAEGTGLGLSIVAGIVNRADGHLQFTREGVDGTEVIVTLPIVEKGTVNEQTTN